MTTKYIAIAMALSGCVLDGADDEDAAACGNGELDADEACDDGNHVASDGPRHSQIEDPPNARAAIDIVLSELGAPDLNVTVYWSAERIPYGSTSVIGMHYSCDEIWVTWVPAMRMWQTALAHEVGHCIRVAAGRDSDQTHLDTDWWEGDVEEARLALRQSTL